MKNMFLKTAHIIVAMLLLCVMACGDSNPYDATQKPVVTATPAGVISWTPANAHIVRVYKGDTPGDSYDARLIWSIGANTKNSIQSPVTFGVVPAGATIDFPKKEDLKSGEKYTVVVTRADPKGEGDGFTNTSNSYVGNFTFTTE
jgi:hypothetical protein